MRIRQPKKFASGIEESRIQITNHIIKLLKNGAMKEITVLNEVYLYYNEILPFSMVLALKKRGLKIENGIWSFNEIVYEK